MVVPPEFESRLAALEDRRTDETTGPALSTNRLERRLTALEERVREAAARKSSPAPPPTHADGPRPGDPDFVWDDRALDWVKGALAEVRYRDTLARHAKNYHAVIDRFDPSVASDRREEAVARILSFHEAARRLYPQGSAGDSKEARDETARQLTKLRVSLQADLRELVGVNLAARLMSAVPGARGPRDPSRTPVGRGR